MQQAEKCPVCKEDWSGESFVGERAVEEASRVRPSTNVRQQTQDTPDSSDGDAGAAEDSEEEEG
jgi:hypothetical protein